MNGKVALNFCVYILFVISIFILFAKSLFLDSGYLSADSANYLSLSQNLVDGKGFFVASDGRSGSDSTFFAVWPVGYPLLIASVSKLLGVSVFFASKVLNALFLLGSMLIISKVFYPNGVVLSCVLLFSASIEIHSHTWSEVPFIFFLVCLASVIGRIADDPRRISFYVYIGVFLLLSGLFLSRYIGLFAVAPVIAAAAIFYCKGQKKVGVILFITGAFAVLSAALYLLHNKYMTGYATGMPRIPAPESNIELFKALIIALMRELVPPMTIVPIGRVGSPSGIAFILLSLTIYLLIVREIVSSKRNTDIKFNNHEQSFFLIGAAYLAAVVYSRWTTQFDGFSFRLIHPGMLLVFIASFSYVIRRYQVESSSVSACLVALAFLSVLSQGSSTYRDLTAVTYYSATEARKMMYAHVPHGSTVVSFGDIHLRYLRPDIHVASPKFRPYSFFDETWEEFLMALDWSRPVFVQVEERARVDGLFHESVREIIRRNEGRGIFALE